MYILHLALIKAQTSALKSIPHITVKQTLKLSLWHTRLSLSSIIIYCCLSEIKLIVDGLMCNRLLYECLVVTIETILESIVVVSKCCRVVYVRYTRYRRMHSTACVCHIGLRAVCMCSTVVTCDSRLNSNKTTSRKWDRTGILYLLGCN